MLAADCVPVHNAEQPTDVNQDAQISPIDALLTINHLIDVSRSADAPCSPEGFALDVNNDGEVWPNDAIRVINQLNDREDDDQAESEPGDIELPIGDQTSVIYNSESGEISFSSTVDLRVVQMISASGIFIPENAVNLNGDFDINRPHEMTKIAVDTPFFQSVSLGNIAPTGLTAEFLAEDLKIEGAPDGGGILSNDWLNIGVEFRDDQGREIESVNVGETFEVVITVEDNQPGPIDPQKNGVFAAYLDVGFDPVLATVDSELRFSDTYDTVRTGTVLPGSIDELGAAASSVAPVGRELRELVSWEMTAVSAGTFGIDLDPADNLPWSDSLLYGFNDPVDPLLIQFYDEQTIEITGEIAQADPIRIEIGGDRFVVYDPETGDLSTESPTEDFRVIQMISASGSFISDNAINLGGDFDIAKPTEITKVQISDPFWGNLSFGNILPTGLTAEFLAEDLTIEGAPAEGGALTENWAEVVVRFETLAGEPISSVEIGESFNIVVDVTSRQPGPLDSRAILSAAAMDLAFDRSLATVLEQNISSEEFSLSHDTLAPWGIDELSGMTLTVDGVSDGPQTLAKIPAIATDGGLFEVASSAADLTGNVFQFADELEPINPLRIDFNGAALVIEGDAANDSRDLVAFAQAIAASGATFYGAAWCPHCTAQKELFEDGGKYLPFVEVTNGDRSRNQIGIDNNISVFPTWVLEDGTRHEGIMSLDELSAFTGIEIPKGGKPHLASPRLIDGGTITVLAGSPLHIPLDGYDPNGDPLNYSVTTDDASIVSGELLDENRRLRISTAGYGDMVFHLFDSEAPRVTEQITSLAESGFYDGVTFHRIIDNFMMQGGDPTGTGGGGSELPDFDDQFDIDLQHNRDGVLSMAKAGDDSNNSQFFITDTATRHLDFNHSIFGQLIEGDDVRDAITSTATGAGNRPALPITMESVDVFHDVEDGMLRLFANADSGTTSVHVTVDDGRGNITTTSFDVVVQPDTSNSPPFLSDIPEQVALNDSITVDLEAVDAENDPIIYEAEVTSGNATIDVNSETGQIVVTSFDIGFVTIRAQVSGASSAGFDEQYFDIDFRDRIHGIPFIGVLQSDSDSGYSQTDRITNAEELLIEFPNTFIGKEIELRVGSEVLATQTLEASDTVISVDASSWADDTYTLSYFDVASPTTAGELNVTIDRTAPAAVDIPVLDATVGVLTSHKLTHPEGGSPGFEYTVFGGDAQIVVTQGTGDFWLRPNTVGELSVDIGFVDAAGNQTVQTITFNVSENPDPLINLAAFVSELGAELFFDSNVDSDTLKTKFGQDAFDLLPVGDASELPADSFPAIRFNGQTATNLSSIEEIANFVGFSLGTDEPVKLTDTTIATFGSKIIPLGATPDTATAVVNAIGTEGAVDAYISTGNPHLRLDVAGYGTMVFEIFESHVPGLASHLSELVESGHYDGLEFYRVNGDLIQAGDPSNLSLPAASSASVDDEFHRDLRHSQSGMLAMAKMVDDGIGDNFFVTSKSMPEFDFHYSIVGKIVDGEEVQAAIQSAQTIVGGFPKQPIVISSAAMSFDESRATLFVTADAQGGDSDVTVTRGDDVQTFRVTVNQGQSNTGPFIKSVTPTPVVGARAIVAEDVEGDPIRYRAFVVDESGASVAVEPNGVLTVTAPDGFVGTVEVDVMISSAASALQVDRFDRQRISIPVNPNGGVPITIGELDSLCVGFQTNSGDIQDVLDAANVIAGDVNLDGVFDSTDLIRIFEAAAYEDDVSGNSTWSTGDFNCDGEFDSSDLVVAFEAATYTRE